MHHPTLQLRVHKEADLGAAAELAARRLHQLLDSFLAVGAFEHAERRQVHALRIRVLRTGRRRELASEDAVYRTDHQLSRLMSGAASRTVRHRLRQGEQWRHAGTCLRSALEQRQSRLLRRLAVRVLQVQVRQPDIELVLLPPAVAK